MYHRREKCFHGLGVDEVDKRDKLTRTMEKPCIPGLQRDDLIYVGALVVVSTLWNRPARGRLGKDTASEVESMGRREGAGKSDRICKMRRLTEKGWEEGARQT